MSRHDDERWVGGSRRGFRCGSSAAHQGRRNWTAEDGSSYNCEVDTFATSGTFTGDKDGDTGKWRGGGTTITMKWTAGGAVGLVFRGTFTKTPVKEYAGTFSLDGQNTPGVLVKGAVSGC